MKERCQKGIPPSLRGRAWLFLTGGKVRREQNQGKFLVSPIFVIPGVKWSKNVKYNFVKADKMLLCFLGVGQPARRS